MQTEVAHPTDPIFAVIETHRQASRDWQIAIDRGEYGEEEEQSFSGREGEAYLTLRKTMPTTMAGLVAYFAYLQAGRDAHHRSKSVFEHLVWEEGDPDELMRWVRLMEVAVRRIAATSA
jgi:hypothetical protein